ncbi:hypothetical protein Btru_035159 [Bulinus truncatus]|nr:hypothetical protein Btru_035159 [Bulinus truncatus]
MGRHYLRKSLILFQVALLFFDDFTNVRGIDPLDPIIETDKGKVRGFYKHVYGKRVDVFYGIPFAKPPVGNLRYKAPIEPDPFEHVLNATQLPNACMQAFDYKFPNFEGSSVWNPNTPVDEDCLYLNVWVPRTNPPYQDKAVIVWIYGGSFFSGSSSIDIYQADYLAAENDVIVVTVQYRLGSLGFLALNTIEAPGNAGLLDQRMALQWVNTNIKNFGGSSSSVTVMGESAGAVSVGLLLLSPLVRGKFQRAILQSGSPQAKWGALPKHEILSRSIKFASYAGCYKDDDHDYVVKCLRMKNATDFPLLEYRVSSGIIQFPFVPMVDGVLIPHDPQHLLDSGSFPRIPLLLGSNENESPYFFIYEHEHFTLNATPTFLPKDYDFFIEQLMFEFYPHFPHKTNKIGKEAIGHYYRNWLKPYDSWEMLRSLDRAASDFYFVCPVNYLARSYARHDVPVYYYWFNHRWSANPWPSWMGVLHADEIWFLFGHPLNKTLSFTKDEEQLSRDMMRYWANFAKTGDPNKPDTNMTWPQFKAEEQAYLNFTIGKTSGQYFIGYAPQVQQCAFWDHYFPTLLAQTSKSKIV